MKKRVVHIIILFLTGFLCSYAQKTQVKKADKLYDSYQYIDAVETYKKIVEKGYKSPEILRKLANAYYFNANYKESVKWYSELFSIEPVPQDPEYYYRYAQSLKSIEEYNEADEYLEKFYKVKGNDYRAKLFSSERNYLDVIEENSGRYVVENLSTINSEMSDYGAVLYNGELIFASTRKADKLVSKKMGWNNQPFSVLYSSRINKNETFEEVKTFSEKLDSKFNESTPVFTKDGNTVYFTRNNYLKKRGFNNQKTTLLKIYRAVLKDGKWSDITELPFNSDDYNVAHPAISPDEKTLYFVSDMPGTIGDADIWKVTVNTDGSFGAPVNLGTSVNTEARESFPFVTDENELYYASTGKLGLGGLDIFVSKITDDGKYEEAMNVGRPVNSQSDDFAFYIDTKSREGFFTSNREGGVGDDDIYKFSESRKLVCEQQIEGIVKNIDSGEILSQTKVSLFDENGTILISIYTDEQGKYILDKKYANCDKSYRIRVEKEDYSTEEKHISTPKNPQKFEIEILMKGIKIVPKVGDDLKDLLDIPIIYFDLNKSDIRQDAESELAKILQVMQDYPEMKVDIRSHTDSRQTHAYNEALSEGRAKSTRQWLIDRGISSDRLTAKGYGETQLLNKCSDNIPCTEEEHQLNRRSEFIITSMD